MQQTLSKKWLSLSKLGKFFVLYTALIVIVVGLVYAFFTVSALRMDPSSFECTSDSMMKQICADPFGSSIIWTIMLVLMFGWPILIIWIVTAVLLRRRHKRN
ncbi:MAG: hypothetical protein ABIQ64_03310 [Candidatus Saccharimonadales bacterium]